jgi:glucan biosynthesis protein
VLRRTWQALLQVLSVTLVTALLSSASGQSDIKEPLPKPGVSFTFVQVQRLAQARAARPYVKPSEELPAALSELSYDQYRDIRYRADHALWHNQSLFEVQFFHRGFNFGRKVAISEVTDAGVQPLVYDSGQFDFGPLTKPVRLPPDTGFAGFRVHFPLQTPRYRDELIVFLGASYFRVLGRNQIYGLSARGLAVDTATAGARAHNLRHPRQPEHRGRLPLRRAAGRRHAGGSAECALSAPLHRKARRRADDLDVPVRREPR